MVNTTLIVVPIFALVIAIEALFDRFSQTDVYETEDTWTNIFVGFVSLVFDAVFVAIFSGIYLICYELTPWRMPVDAVSTWIMVIILDDFCFYWLHRTNHESRFFWNFHVVHHSSEYYNLSVAVRQSWFGSAVSWMFYLPLAFLGFPLWMQLTAHGFNVFYQFFIHTQFVRKLGFLEIFMNTPSHHRVHHGINDAYIDKNYGGIFIIWDKMFGTFTAETETPRYGVIKQIKSFNWFWINTHGWAEMFAAMNQRKTLMGKIRCIFDSPNMDFTE